MSESSALLQEIETLERAAKSYDGRHEFIEDFRYPDGVRIAVNFTCDFDAMLLRRVFEEPPMQLAQGEFGAVGTLRPAGDVCRTGSDDRIPVRYDQADRSRRS